MLYFLRNYGMNAKIHHSSIRLHVLGRTMQAQLSSFTFMAWNWALFKHIQEGRRLMEDHVRTGYSAATIDNTFIAIVSLLLN